MSKHSDVLMVIKAWYWAIMVYFSWEIQSISHFTSFSLPNIFRFYYKKFNINKGTCSWWIHICFWWLIVNSHSIIIQFPTLSFGHWILSYVISIGISFFYVTSVICLGIYIFIRTWYFTTLKKLRMQIKYSCLSQFENWSRKKETNLFSVWNWFTPKITTIITKQPF